MVESCDMSTSQITLVLVPATSASEAPVCVDRALCMELVGRMVVSRRRKPPSVSSKPTVFRDFMRLAAGCTWYLASIFMSFRFCFPANGVAGMALATHLRHFPARNTPKIVQQQKPTASPSNTAHTGTAASWGPAAHWRQGRVPLGGLPAKASAGPAHSIHIPRLQKTSATSSAADRLPPSAQTASQLAVSQAPSCQWASGRR
mmetsp:Transcript_45552/g.108297  ORF Transcript_45552/g.108297 Transcript_45552/m.108297 type:complete len:203 (+) Transcript_45552:323-931(+)